VPLLLRLGELDWITPVRTSAVRGRGRLRFFPLVDLNELDGGDRRDPDGLRQSLPWQTMRSKI
jgi:hypothetical protein